MSTKNITLFLFSGFFLIYLCVAFYIAYVLNIYHNDAISRTALGFFTIFGRNPHLAAIGFVWQPLPSLTQLPFLILLRPFGYTLMAGPIISALCGALSIITVFHISHFIIKKRTRMLSLLVAVLFGLNPLIILYSVIGTSEMIFISSLLLSTYFMVKWISRLKPIDLIVCSFFVSLSFWSRYESLPVFIGYFFLIIYIGYIKKLKLKQLEGMLVQFTVPFLYSVIIWVGANWLIMKDPLYFLHSEYSNTAFTQALRADPGALEFSYQSVANTLAYTGKRLIALSPVLLLLPIFFIDTLISIKKKSEDRLLLLAVTFPYLCILAFHMFQLYKGESFGWLRFFMYGIPAGVLLSSYIIQRNTKLTIASLLLLVLCIVNTSLAIGNPNLGKEEISFVQKIQNPTITLDYSRTYIDQKAVAGFMNDKKGKVLLDTTNKGFAIPLFAVNPNKYVITSDSDFLKIVKNYPSFVEWVILKKPNTEDLTLNKIYSHYPGIWEGNVPNVKLVKEMHDWRIFKVTKKIEVVKNLQKNN